MIKSFTLPIFEGTEYDSDGTYVTDGHYEIPATNYVDGKYVADKNAMKASVIFCPKCGNVQFFSALIQEQIDTENNAL